MQNTVKHVSQGRSVTLQIVFFFDPSFDISIEI